MKKIVITLLSVQLSILINNNCVAQPSNKITKEARHYIKICADSINSLEQKDSIPAFVYDERFDYQSRYWVDLHHPIPLRKLVIERINNKNAIIRILNANDARLFKKHEVVKITNGLTYYVMPYIERPSGELLEERLFELNHKNKN